VGITLVLVTAAGGAVDEVSLQALAQAREFDAAGDVHALVLSDGPEATTAADLGAWGATRIHIARHEAPGTFAPDAWARVVDDLAEQLGAGLVLGPGTDRGNTVLARAAARRGLPFAANCTRVTAGNPVTVTRSRWGGSLLERAAVHAGRVIASVAPHAVHATRRDGTAPVEILAPSLDESDLAVRPVARIPTPPGGISLADARVVVSGGRGAGSADGFQPIEELATLLGAAVGCSRAVTIAGWRPHTMQVGQTGARIAPDLYIACGISGASQHLAGCRGAKRILAVNKDPDAPIMAAADAAVIGDLHQVLPAISAAIRRGRGA